MLACQKKTSGKTRMGFMKQFKGTCRTCGKYGHKAAECLHKKNKEESSHEKCHFSGKCFTVARMVTGSANVARRKHMK